MSSILVVGSLALDTVETPFARAVEVVGGSAVYFSAAASFFAPVRVVGVVGRDFPMDELAFLSARGVDLSGLEVADGKTFRWSGRYHPNMVDRDTLRTDLNVFQDFAPKLPGAFRSSTAVFLANIDPVLQREVLAQIDRPRLSALDTMNYWIDSKKDDLLSTMQRVDLLILNDSEALQLTGEPNLVRAARRLTAIGPRAAVIKKGEHGSVLASDGDLFVLPAFPLADVADPTGAGDTFAGGLVGYLASQPTLSTDALRRGVVYGTVLASFCVEKFSVQRLAELTREEVEVRSRALESHVAIPASV